MIYHKAQHKWLSNMKSEDELSYCGMVSISSTITGTNSATHDK